ncbi:glycoside hydrolase family 26 protein [Micromonospora aurantiaca (nom. illeg.)]|uniref:glycoside hydrolase family 26 protein n=1 Tax=Micromonospora aurantiaca (nom. illeg.) TaxID=47850 RepID=UPI0001BF4B2B|nr:glycosyl hydrolase [Micromonospora aurantiaca]ADL47163.1 beta-mannanase-like protein [Micromonospora aurantiaca ATCC 27029]
MLRPTLPRMGLALAGVLLLAYAFVVAPGAWRDPATDAAVRRPAPATPQASTDVPAAVVPSPRGGPFPPAGQAFFGVMTDKGPYDFAPVDRFADAAGRSPQVMLFGADWVSAAFDRSLFDRIAERGMMPMLGWEPWDHTVDKAARRTELTDRQIDRLRATQPDYRLSRIARGDFDAYLRSWADGVRSLGYPVAIRFAHEMNGDWYPWCERANGNRPGDYVRAWRHVHDVFAEAGATNVTWVWSPNARWDKTTAGLTGLYAGDEYVDWVGVTGYYGSGAFTKTYWSFDQIFGPTIAEIRKVTGKPLVVTETGAADAAGHKARWIRDTFRALPRYPNLIGLIWFEVDKEKDWRIAGSPAAATAFAEAVAAERYDVTWSPAVRPREGP